VDTPGEACVALRTSLFKAWLPSSIPAPCQDHAFAPPTVRARTAQELNRRSIELINNAPRTTHTITFDNGTEFHSYKEIERATGADVYFATPHHSWEPGTCENTNGLLRQYLKKGQSMARLTQRHCNQLARKLNDRPRKKLGFRTPQECYETQDTD